ncbi:MAG: addiction module protein [Acidobacteriota bacterium]|nr:MAG: addiction module protein [Acidobacteriota bacterium]
MSVIADVEELALALQAADRGKLAEKLIRSLPSPGWDNDDDGVAEATRRSDELKKNPEIGISIEELDRRIRERFGWKS